MNGIEPVLPCAPFTAKGTVLIEALVAFLILALGVVTLMGFHGAVQISIAEAKNRAEATALAEERLNALRAGSDDAPLGGSGCDAIPWQTLIYDRCWQILATTVPTLQRTAVTIAWQDRSGVQQAASLVSAVSPASRPQSVANLRAWLEDKSLSQDAINQWYLFDTEVSEEETIEPGDDESSEEEEHEDPDPEEGEPPDVTVTSVRIAGRFAPGAPESAVLLSAVTESALYGECDIEDGGTAFSCRVLFNELSSGWSGNLVLHTNMAFCSVVDTAAELTWGAGTVALSYDNLTSNDTGIVIVVAQYPDDC